MKKTNHNKFLHAMRGIGNWFGGAMKAFIAIAAFALSSTAWAVDSWWDGSKYTWYYTDYDGGVAIYKSTFDAAIEPLPEPGTDLVVPATINGKTVKGLARSALTGCTGIRSVMLPDGLKLIGVCAFSDCSGLEVVHIPEGVTQILDEAFLNCASLQYIDIPESVTSIGISVFQDCTSLKSVELHDSVTSIGGDAFKNCTSLEEVRLPEGFVWSGVMSDYFSGCSDDLAIVSAEKVGALTWNFRVVNGGAEICYNSEDDEATIDPKTEGAVVIPDTLGGFPVVSIGEEAFTECDKLTSVTVPATVTSIGDGAFSHCSSLVLPVSFPDTVTNIGDEAFRGCDAMADANGFVIVRNVLHHYTDKDDQVTIPDGVTRIGGHAFSECSIYGVRIPATVTSIGPMAFSKCANLEGIDIPASVTDIGDGAFWRCDAMADENGFVIVRDVLYWYDGDATTVTIPGGVTAVSMLAFNGNDNVKKVTLPASVTSIGGSAFLQCIYLKEATIPRSVTSIGHFAFSYIDGFMHRSFPLVRVHVEAGDTERVKSLLTSSSHPVSGITFVEDVLAPCVVTFDANGGSVSPTTRLVTKGTAIGNLPEPVRDGFIFNGWFTAADGGEAVASGTIVSADATYYAHWTDISAAVWHTSRAAAIAAALKTGKKIFLVCGRDTCYNTMTTKNVSCEDPAVKAALTAKCVLWYSNCDTQEEENDCYWPMGVSVTLPLVCVIDPKDPDNFIKRTTGGDYGGPLSRADVLAFIADIPYPAGADPSASGTTSSGATGYVNLSPSGITAPYSAGKTLYGAVYSGYGVVGVVELKLAKVNIRKGTSKVSGTVTLLDGKRYTIKGAQGLVSASAPLTVTLEVKKVGIMTVTIGGDQFSGSLGGWHVQTANVGGTWKSSTVTVSVNLSNLSMLSGTVLEDLLPLAEKGFSSGLRWTFPKAAVVKWAKPKFGEEPVVLDAASGKGLIVNTSKGDNLSGMKLTYTAKKGTFKGSFKVYALENSGTAIKLKKYTLNVGGVVVDGVGYGSATCKRPAITWSVTVE